MKNYAWHKKLFSWIELGRILRLGILVSGLAHVATVPSDTLFSARIFGWHQIEGKFPSTRYFSLLDFLGAFFMGLLMSHSLFWSCISKPKEHWPLWGAPALRFLDYFWYAGAAIGLIFIAAEAQRGVFLGQIKEYQRLIPIHVENRTSAIKAAINACDIELRQPDNDSSNNFLSAYQFVKNVCGDVATGAQGKPPKPSLIIRSVRPHCAAAPIDFSTFNPGPVFDVGFVFAPNLYGTYAKLADICYNDFQIRAYQSIIRQYSPMVETTEYVTRNPIVSGYLSWFALLLAFRLARTSSEVTSEIRIALASQWNPDRPKTRAKR